MTGGQTALSLEAVPTAEAAETLAAVSRTGELKLRVIEASDDELAAHEALLDKLRDRGECVWDRLPG